MRRNGPYSVNSLYYAAKGYRENPFYSAKNQAVLLESIRELDSGQGQEHELIDA